MESNLLKINILSIAGAGLLTFVLGIALYLFRDQAAPHLRFFLPIPPLAVAAYVFVFNMYRYHQAALPTGQGLARDLLVATGVAALVFGGFSLLLAFAISLVVPRG